MMLDATRLRVLVAVARHGSVTAAAHALNYAQPSISHHMAKLEAETGAKLMVRSGRGVKLTEAGQLLAERAEEIIGRLDAAEAELAAHVGLRQERVRLAAFGSALSTLVATGVSAIRAQRTGSEPDVLLTQAEPEQALRMVRTGAVDVALTFRYVIRGGQAAPDRINTGSRTHSDGAGDVDYSDGADDVGGVDGVSGVDDVDDPTGVPGMHYQLLLDEPLYLITPGEVSIRPAVKIASLADYAGHRWIAGCYRCRDNLVRLCGAAGFAPNVVISTDDYVSVQAFVAAGLGVALLPGLALRAARHQGITITELSEVRRQVHAVTYGTPPVPPATARLIDALTKAASLAKTLILPAPTRPAGQQSTT